jgi:hypothetical protein
MSRGTTDAWGVTQAWEGLRFALSEINRPRVHPQILLRHAILWASILNEAYWRLGREDYRAARDDDVDGVVIEGIRMARDALLHGAALCADVRPDVVSTGMRVGPWSWSTDVAAIVKTLDHNHPPSPEQLTSYQTELAGKSLAAPIVRAQRWFETAQKTWPLG